MSYVCDWCKKETDKLYALNDLGNTYNVCNECRTSYGNNVCRKCGNTSNVYLYMGLCHFCSQDEERKRSIEEEEMNSGVALELLQAYANGVEFTEEDFQHWMTFSQGTFSPQYLKMCRQNWLREKLVKQGGWDADVVESNMESIETIMSRHVSKVMSGTYVLVNYNGVDNKQLRTYIDKENNILLVKKSDIEQVKRRVIRRKKTT